MRDLPGDPGIKTVASNAGFESLIPGQEAEIPDVSWPRSQNKKQKQYCNEFNSLKMAQSKKTKTKTNHRKARQNWCSMGKGSPLTLHKNVPAYVSGGESVLTVLCFPSGAAQWINLDCMSWQTAWPLQTWWIGENSESLQCFLEAASRCCNVYSVQWSLEMWRILNYLWETAHKHRQREETESDKDCALFNIPVHGPTLRWGKGQRPDCRNSSRNY